MSQEIIETVYLLRDNPIRFILKTDRRPADLSTVTKVEVQDLGCNWTVDSDADPEAFNIGTTDGLVELFLGQQTIPQGQYQCRLVVYDPSNPDGIVWGDFTLIVKFRCPEA